MKTDSRSIPILVADDNRQDQVLMKAALEAAEVRNPVEFVRDGQELLERLRGGAALPGLILMDLNMPGLGGKAALQALRADPKLSHLPVLIVSTSAFEQEVSECYRLGANAFMVKPFDYEEFVRLLAATADYWLKRVELPLQA